MAVQEIEKFKLSKTKSQLKSKGLFPDDLMPTKARTLPWGVWNTSVKLEKQKYESLVEADGYNEN